MDVVKSSLVRHDANMNELVLAVTRAGGMFDGMTEWTVQDFLHMLAQNCIEITAKWVGDEPKEATVSKRGQLEKYAHL